MAMLEDEPAAAAVERAIESGDAIMSWINLGEVYYTVARRSDEEIATLAVRSLSQAMVVEEPDANLVLAAAGIKAAHPISYADTFAVATAERHGVPLMTGDRELIELELEALQVIDLR